MKWKESGAQFENPPSGSFIARCYALIDLGTQHRSAWQGEERPPARMVRLSFELPTEKMEGKYDAKVAGKPFSVHMTVKQSLHVKANLRRYLEGWRGKKFTAESVAAFDPKKLLGLPCRLTLVENGDYVNVDAISPLGKGEDKKMPKQVNKSVYVSLEAEEFDAEAFEKLGEKTREKIKKSPEWQALDSGGSPSESEQGDAPEGEPEGGGDPF